MAAPTIFSSHTKLLPYGRFKFYQLEIEISSTLGVGLIDGDSASKTKLHDMYLQKYSS